MQEIRSCISLTEQSLFAPLRAQTLSESRALSVRRFCNVAIMDSAVVLMNVQDKLPKDDLMALNEGLLNTRFRCRGLPWKQTCKKKKKRIEYTHKLR